MTTAFWPALAGMRSFSASLSDDSKLGMSPSGMELMTFLTWLRSPTSESGYSQTSPFFCQL